MMSIHSLLNPESNEENDQATIKQEEKNLPQQTNDEQNKNIVREKREFDKIISNQGKRKKKKKIHERKIL